MCKTWFNISCISIHRRSGDIQREYCENLQKQGVNHPPICRRNEKKNCSQLLHWLFPELSWLTHHTYRNTCMCAFGGVCMWERANAAVANECFFLSFRCINHCRRAVTVFIIILVTFSVSWDSICDVPVNKKIKSVKFWICLGDKRNCCWWNWRCFFFVKC